MVFHSHFLRKFCWEGESVVYHSASGETHFLNSTSSVYLEKLTKSPSLSFPLSSLDFFGDLEGLDESFLQSQLLVLTERFCELGFLTDYDSVETNAQR